MALPPAPTPRRLSRPKWINLRVIGGILLLVVAIVIGAKVIGASSRTSAVWAADRDLASGHRARARRPGHGRGQPRRQLRPVPDACLRVADRHDAWSAPCAAGELLPASAVEHSGSRPGGRDRRRPRRTCRPGVDHGSTIDLYLTKGGVRRCRGERHHRADRPRPDRAVGDGPRLRRAVRATSNRYQLSVLLPADAADKLVAVLPTGEPSSCWSAARAGEHGAADRGQRPGLGERAGRRAGPARFADDGAAPLRRHRRRAGHRHHRAGRRRRVSADLRRLDTEAVTRLRASGVAVVGVHPAADERARARLGGSASPHWCRRRRAPMPGAGRRAYRGDRTRRRHEPAPRRCPIRRPRCRRRAPAPDVEVRDGPPPRGRVVAVWGPTGAPGRTTVATCLAVEAAAARHADPADRRRRVRRGGRVGFRPARRVAGAGRGLPAGGQRPAGPGRR